MISSKHAFCASRRQSQHELARDQMVANVYGPSLKSWDLLVHHMHAQNWVPRLDRTQVAHACLGIMLEAYGEKVSWN